MKRAPTQKPNEKKSKKKLKLNEICGLENYNSKKEKNKKRIAGNLFNAM